MTTRIFVLIVALAFTARAATNPAPTELPARENETVLLPPFEVREQGITDFGLSIITNREVATGGKIKWMLVGTVVPASAAAQAGLRPGDRIHLVDRAVVTTFSKDAMLRTFFGRRVGATVLLEVADPLTQKRRVVELMCNEVRIEKPRGKAAAK